MLTWKTALWSVLALGALVVTGRPALATDTVPGYVLAKPLPGVNIATVAASYGVRVQSTVVGTSVAVLSLPAGKTADAFAQQLALDVRLEFAEADTYVSDSIVNGDPVHLAFDRKATDTTFRAQWSAPIGVYPSGSPLSQVNLGMTQQRTKGAGVIVAVLDTGIDPNHTLLAPSLLPGINVLKPGTAPFDAADGKINNAVGHGTMVAGIIARVAPAAKILPIRVLNGDGLGTGKGVAEGAMLARLNGARVINMSLSAPLRSRTIEEAMDQAEAAGVTCVVAAGNLGTSAIEYPTDRHEVIVVGAVNPDNTKAVFSNYNGRVTVVAPGVNIRSTYLNGGYATWSGTSFAVPFVSAQAALIRCANPKFTGADVRSAIRGTARSVDSINPKLYQGQLGKGIIDIARSINP